MPIIQDFHKVTLADREAVLEQTKHNRYRNCDYSFSNLYGWQETYGTEIAFHKGMMLVRFSNPAHDRQAYLMPVGSGEVREVLLDLQRDLLERGEENIILMSVTGNALDELKALDPPRMKDFTSRDYCDYIYLRESLATLSGKKLQSKRNHINKFEKLYPGWVYEEITPENAEKCIGLEKVWLGNSDEDPDKLRERSVVLNALRHKDEIGLYGGCIKVDGRVVAFSLGMPVTGDTFDVNIEKADTAYEGSFSIINREFARRIPEQYTYVNREEDLGVEGLRKAKLSYNPELLLCKSTVLLAFDSAYDR